MMSEQQMPELRAREFAAFLLQKWTGTMTSFTIFKRIMQYYSTSSKKGERLGLVGKS